VSCSFIEFAVLSVMLIRRSHYRSVSRVIIWCILRRFCWTAPIFLRGNFFIVLAFTSVMYSFQFSRWSKINLMMRWWFFILIFSLLIQILILISNTRFLLRINIDFVFSADILNPFSFVHLMIFSLLFWSGFCQ
jgi:hypothetical protein